MPKWTYIARLREQAAILRSNNTTAGASNKPGGEILDVELVGHLFDSGVINSALDLLDETSDKVSFSIASCDVRPNLTSTAVPSKILLRLSGAAENVREVSAKITKLVETNKQAEGAVRIFVPTDNRPAAVVKSMAKKRVLLFGSGRVRRNYNNIYFLNIY